MQIKRLSSYFLIKFPVVEMHFLDNANFLEMFQWHSSPAGSGFKFWISQAQPNRSLSLASCHLSTGHLFCSQANQAKRLHVMRLGGHSEYQKYSPVSWKFPVYIYCSFSSSPLSDIHSLFMLLFLLFVCTLHKDQAGGVLHSNLGQAVTHMLSAE